MLLVFRPFKVKQFVNAAGVSGTVAEIGLFTTSLRYGGQAPVHRAQQRDLRLDHRECVVSPRRVAWMSNVGTDYGADIDRDACRADAGGDERWIMSCRIPQPAVGSDGPWGRHRLTGQVRVWVNAEPTTGRSWMR